MFFNKRILIIYDKLEEYNGKDFSLEEFFNTTYKLIEDKKNEIFIDTICSCRDTLEVVSEEKYDIIIFIPTAKEKCFVSEVIGYLRYKKISKLYVVIEDGFSTEKRKKIGVYDNLNKTLRIKKDFLLSRVGFIIDSPNIFISYGKSENSTRFLEGLTLVLSDLFPTSSIIHDKNSLQYKSNPNDFMDLFGRGDYIILLINEKYLRSQYCMYEFSRIAHSVDFDQKRISSKIFPVVLDSAKEIYDEALYNEKIISYWSERLKETKKTKAYIIRSKKNWLKLHWGSNDSSHDENFNQVSGIVDSLNVFREVIKNSSNINNFEISEDKINSLVFEIYEAMRKNKIKTIYQNKNDIKECVKNSLALINGDSA